MGTRGVGGSLTEARRGFSAANYLTDAPYTMEEPHEKVQPFYNEKTGSFDWKYYTEKTGFHPDAVELFLGTNGLPIRMVSVPGIIRGRLCMETAISMMRIKRYFI